MKAINIIYKLIFLCILLFTFNNITYCQKTSLSNNVLSIKGYKPGNIPLDSIKHATRIDIKAPYRFVSANVYFGDHTGKRCIGIRPLNGSLFDDAILGAMDTLDSKSLVFFTDIKILDKSGKILKLSDIFFTVNDN